MSLFAELKATPDNKTDFLAGYRIQFSEGTMTGLLTSNLKAVAIYKRALNEMFQLSMTGSQDFSKPQSPV